MTLVSSVADHGLETYLLSLLYGQRDDGSLLQKMHTILAVHIPLPSVNDLYLHLFHRTYLAPVSPE